MAPSLRDFGISTQLYERDAGIISVPNTNVYTDLITLRIGAPAFLEHCRVAVYDTAAVNVLEWDIVINGIELFPFSAQRIVSMSMTDPIRIWHELRPGALFALRARIPTTAVGAFDALGSLKWQELGGRR